MRSRIYVAFNLPRATAFCLVSLPATPHLDQDVRFLALFPIKILCCSLPLFSFSPCVLLFLHLHEHAFHACEHFFSAVFVLGFALLSFLFPLFLALRDMPSPFVCVDPRASASTVLTSNDLWPFFVAYLPRPRVLLAMAEPSERSQGSRGSKATRSQPCQGY